MGGGLSGGGRSEAWKDELRAVEEIRAAEEPDVGDGQTLVAPVGAHHLDRYYSDDCSQGDCCPSSGRAIQPVPPGDQGLPYPTNVPARVS